MEIKEVSFTRLLAALILMFMLGPILDGLALQGQGWSTVAKSIWGVLLVNVMAWALLASSKNINIRTGIMLGMGGVIFSHIFSVMFGHTLLMIISNLLLAAMLFPSITNMTRYLISRREANIHTISASACIYILMTLFWASLYALIAYIDPEAFSISDNLARHLSDSASGGFSQHLYYSIVTITTLGFGDITPVNAFARSLTVMEAFVGPFYLAVIVARLVALHLK